MSNIFNRWGIAYVNPLMINGGRAQILPLNPTTQILLQSSPFLKIVINSLTSIFQIGKQSNQLKICFQAVTPCQFRHCSNRGEKLTIENQSFSFSLSLFLFKWVEGTFRIFICGSAKWGFTSNLNLLPSKISLRM